MSEPEHTHIEIKSAAQLMAELSNTSERDNPAEFERLHAEWKAALKEQEQK